MPAVTVWGKGSAVTDAYAGGQVASGGRVGLGDKDFMKRPSNHQLHG
jgi:iron complex outermembrane receptor protein